MTRALDEYFPRDTQPDGGAMNRLTAADMTGPGGLYDDHPMDPGKTTKERVAELIGLLWGVKYGDAGPKLKGDMRRAAVWVLVDGRGDLTLLEKSYRAIDRRKADEAAWYRRSWESCATPYSVARKWYSEAARLAAQEKRQGVLDASPYLAYLQNDEAAPGEESRG